MAKLTSIDLPDADTKKSSNNIPTIEVDGDTVTRYNEACDQMDKAEAVINELKPVLHEAGLQAVFEHNVEHAGQPKEIISSINLVDRREEGDEDEAERQKVQMSWTRKDLKNNAQQVEAEFKRLRTVDGKKADINLFAGYEVVAKFDAAVFMVDGKFNRERYDAFVEAMKEVSARFNVDNPLTCGKVLKPKPDFHDRRWTVFDVESNLAIQTVLPTQVNLKPIRPEAE